MTTPRCTYPDLPGYVGRCVLPADHDGAHTGHSATPTLFDDLLDLLDLVGRRDCILGLSVFACDLEECEPCRARELYARMVEARDRAA